MARRNEIQGICNSLLDSFVSRYNDLDGYWALGKFQSYLQTNSDHELCFDLVGKQEIATKNPFSQTASYYHGAFLRNMKVRKLPLDWVTGGQIKVRANSSTELVCSIKITTDQGVSFGAQKSAVVRPHDPMVESRSGLKHGPKNQKGE